MAKKTAAKKDSVSFTVTLPTSLCDILDRKRDESKRSRNGEVHWILENYLKRLPKHPSILEAIMKASEQF